MYNKLRETLCCIDAFTKTFECIGGMFTRIDETLVRIYHTKYAE